MDIFVIYVFGIARVKIEIFSIPLRFIIPELARALIYVTVEIEKTKVVKNC